METAREGEAHLDCLDGVLYLEEPPLGRERLCLGERAAEGEDARTRSRSERQTSARGHMHQVEQASTRELTLIPRSYSDRLRASKEGTQVGER